MPERCRCYVCHVPAEGSTKREGDGKTFCNYICEETYLVFIQGKKEVHSKEEECAHP